MSKTSEQVWESCLKIIKDNVNLQSYKTWFDPIKPISLEGKVLTIQVPSLFFYEWLEEHYVSLLKKTIKKELGQTGKLEYNIVVENSSGNNNPYTINMPAHQSRNSGNMEVSMPVNISNSIKNPFIIPGLKKINIDSHLNHNLTFDTFIEGECNRLARSAGMAVAAKPGGTSFNPLMIYSSVGLGKTHLLQAIGNKVRENFKNKIVLYVSSERFTNQFIESLKNDTINDFINFFQLIDVLMVDDVHFFAKKEKTQDIFFHIFNHLHQNNKQLILTSDRPPSELKGLEERLISRFKWGLTADLHTPDFETRMAILENKMYENGIQLPNEVVEYVAYNVITTVRELEGALISLLAYASFNKSEIDLKMAKQILKNFISNTNKKLSIEQIQNIISEHFNMPVEQLVSKSRKREIVQARQVSMYFSKQLTKESLSKIGRLFGGRDHSTVIHACQTVCDLMDTDKKFKVIVEELEKKININLV